MIADPPAGEPFLDLDSYVALPRVSGLRLSPDGRRLVVGVATPDRKKTRYVTALWEVDPEGGRSARRLTRSDKGESVAAFTPDGDLLFTSKRPAPDGDADDTTALWLQPAGGGDARVVANPSGGVSGVVVSESGRVVLASEMLPSATGPDNDKDLRDRRTEAGVTAILHEEYPIRFWDHHLGPGRTRLLVGDPGEETLSLRDLTGYAGAALDRTDVDVAPDGRTVVASWLVSEPGGAQRRTLVAIDVTSGERRVLADDVDHEYDGPRISPDGQRVAVVVHRRSGPHDPPYQSMGVVPLAGGPVEPLTTTWERWPSPARWTPDGAALIVAADHDGRSPLWRIDATTGEPTRLTPDDGAYTDIQVSPDGRWVYALRSAVDAPPAPVRVAADGTGTVEPLRGPAPEVPLPGRLEEVTATADDGTPLRAWIAVPHGAGADSPAPLLLWVHGGPLRSWNSWSWRWNPWTAVARGYAVLLPDPALSTGYGDDFVRRGWGAWGAAPYTDLLTVTDAAESRDDIDATRTAAMGGSFGGYMANWIAGHTDRFAAIVTHAALWSLDQMLSTTDLASYWVREMTPDMIAANSPHLFADRITTPMLVIHGDKDYRVPLGEALGLWWDLLSRSTAADGSTPHRFLYFPDENHWILKPQHAKVWYSTVFAFLAQHVLGEEWQRPDLLG
jgi:dipeptidyl aminopeptidase/acylaminoacyl peptidase